MENQTLTGISNTEMQQRELDIVIKARQIAQNGESLRSRFNAMLNLYENQPTIRPTDTKSKLFQQYSTPCPLAFLASEYVKQEGDRTNRYYFEPSAGNGMLTISLPVHNTYVNELDEVRYRNLQKQGFGGVTQLDSSKKEIEPYGRNFFHGIVTNPPFKSLNKSEQVIYNGFLLTTLDYKMTAIALSQMKDTGKAAVIVGGKLFDNYWKPIKGTDKQMLFGQWKVFLGWLYGQYDVVDVIYIGGDYIYRKQGTTYPVVLILIKGRHAFNKDKYKPRYIFGPEKDKIIETYEQLFARVSPYITDTRTTQPDVHPLFQNEIKIAMEKQNEYQNFQGFNQNTTDNIMDGSNYDNKHINNLAPDKIIPYSVIENISKEGMTLESIDKLTSQGFPVCKYHTQITVHGNCPKLKSEYVGKYKCLTINQNQSLGIRWIGIDDGKKKRLAEIAIKIRNVVESNNPNDYEIHPSNWWYYSKDSQNTTFYTYLGKCEKPSGWIYTPSQRQKEEAHKIVTDLYNKLKGKFFGHVFTIQGNLQSLYLCVNILGIYEKNIPYFIETVFGYNQAQLQKILSDFDRKKADAETKQKAADEHEEKTKQEAQKQYDEYKEEWISRHPIPSEFVKPQPGEMPQQGDIICYYYLPSINTFWHSEPQAEYVFLKEKFDVNARFAFKTFYKSFGKMCYCNCDINGNKPSEHYKRDSREYGGGFQPNWYVKRASAKTKPTATSTTTAPTVSSADLQIVDYSDKAIVLTGDTKPLKDQIKALGGKFGSRFDTSKVPSGIGWLFPKTKLAQVEDFVKKYSKKSEPKIHQLFRNEIELTKIKTKGNIGALTTKKSGFNTAQNTALAITIEQIPTALHSAKRPQGDYMPYTNSQSSSQPYPIGDLFSDKDIKISINNLKKLLKNWDISDAHTFALIVANRIGAEASEEIKESAEDTKSISYYLNLPKYSLRIGLHNLNAENYKGYRNRPKNHGVTLKDYTKKDTFRSYKGVNVKEYVYLYWTKERLKKIAEAILHLLETGIWVSSIAEPDYINPKTDYLKGIIQDPKRYNFFREIENAGLKLSDKEMKAWNKYNATMRYYGSKFQFGDFVDIVSYYNNYRTLAIISGIHEKKKDEGEGRFVCDFTYVNYNNPTYHYNEYDATHGHSSLYEKYIEETTQLDKAKDFVKREIEYRKSMEELDNEVAPIINKVLDDVLKKNTMPNLLLNEIEYAKIVNNKKS